MGRPCRFPGCPEIVEAGYCSTHKSTGEYPSHPVYRTKRWKLLRRRKLNLNPICESCYSELASEVHHKVAINDGGPEYPPLVGLASLCRKCHSRITSHEVRTRQYG